MQSYFTDEKSTVEFLKLFSKWLVISNPETTLSANNYIGSAALIGDQKPPFLPAMAEWVKT